MGMGEVARVDFVAGKPVPQAVRGRYFILLVSVVVHFVDLVRGDHEHGLGDDEIDAGVAVIHALVPVECRFGQQDEELAGLEVLGDGFQVGDVQIAVAEPFAGFVVPVQVLVHEWFAYLSQDEAERADFTGPVHVLCQLRLRHDCLLGRVGVDVAPY